MLMIRIPILLTLYYYISDRLRACGFEVQDLNFYTAVLTTDVPQVYDHAILGKVFGKRFVRKAT